jgi:COMPASS component SWD3
LLIININNINMTSLKRSADNQILSEDPPPFECLPFYGSHKRAVSSVQLAPSRLTKSHSALCASASADGTVKIWDVAAGATEVGDDLMPGSSTIRASNSVGGGSSSSGAKHVQMNPLESMVGHSRGINEVCWSNSGDPFVATASDDKTSRLWDAQTGDALVEFRGHDNFVFCCEFNASSNLLATGSFDETVKLWDVRSGECVSTLPAHSDPVTAVSFNRDGTCVVSASHDGLIRIWDVCTGECLKTIVAEGNPPVSHVTYSPNGKFVLAGTLDGALRLWPLSASGKSRCAKTYTSESHVNTKYCISSRFLVAQPKRRQCVVTGSESGDIILYDIQSRKVHQTLEKVHTDAVLAVDVHDSMELIASGGMSEDCTVRCWAPSEEATTLKRLRKE